MISYSITKFKGYIDETIYKEWTSIWDVGKSYGNKIFSVDEYIKTENKYVEALFLILKYMKIEKLKVKNMSYARYDHDFFDGAFHLYSNDMLETYNNVCDGDINLKQFEHLVRLQLREDIGGLIYVPYRLKIFIGYDYLMSVRTSVKLNTLFKDIENLGLYIYDLNKYWNSLNVIKSR